MIKHLSRWDQLFSSSLRCHLFGSAVSGLLLIAIGWIWFHADWFAKDNRYSNEQIEKSIQLVSEAGNVRIQHAEDERRSKATEQRIKTIKGWIASAIDGEKTTQRIRQIVEKNSLVVSRIDLEKKHIGERVGTQSVICVVEGTYANVCRLLHSLASGNDPVWCDAIQIDRVPDEVDAHIQCRAKISIRVPFAAPGTIAAKLLRVETPNAG